MIRKPPSGNVLLYVLLGIVLFGALSFSLTKQLGSGGMTGTMTENQARLKAEELINYATAARSVIEQMRVMQNILPNEFDFTKPGDPNFDDDPHRVKVYHQGGGGLSDYTPNDNLFASGSAKRGWVWQTGTNVVWTQTTASDIIFTFMDVAANVCQAINERLYKDDSVPDTTINSSATFINGGGDDADFDTSACSSCNEKVSYCVKDSDGNYAFYNVLLSR